jgi:hypothetical protein
MWRKYLPKVGACLLAAAPLCVAVSSPAMASQECGTEDTSAVMRPNADGNYFVIFCTVRVVPPSEADVRRRG